MSRLFSLILALFITTPAFAGMSMPLEVVPNLVCMTYDTQEDIDNYVEKVINHPSVTVVQYKVPHDGYDGFLEFWLQSGQKEYRNQIRWKKGMVCETTRESRPSNNS